MKRTKANQKKPKRKSNKNQKTRFSDEELNNAFKSVNNAIRRKYFWGATRSEDTMLPRKEVAEGMSYELKQIINKITPEQNSSAVKRIRKYLEITELLCTIPGQTFLREKRFTTSLFELTSRYESKFKNIIRGKTHFLAETKSDFIAKKTNLQAKIEGMQFCESMKDGKPDNIIINDLQKLVQVANHYIELTHIGK